MPKKPAEPRVWVSLTLPKDLLDRIQARADEEVRNRSQMIRVLLLQALAANKKTA